MSNKNEPSINGDISAPRVLVIDELGNKLGEFLTHDAVNLAADRGLDLVEVQLSPDLPVCKIVDYGKMKYHKKKREKLGKKSQTSIKIKEIKFHPGIESRDLEIWANKAKKILSGGTRVRVVVKFRGREITHKGIGIDKCSMFQELCKEVSVAEGPPRVEGRNMSMTLIPKDQS